MERQLWCAVLNQAIADATSPLVRDRREHLGQYWARAWFRNASRDFQQVCLLAGYDPDRIRKQVLPMIEAAQPNDKEMYESRPRIKRQPGDKLRPNKQPNSTKKETANAA
jgi:hypothetical protein